MKRNKFYIFLIILTIISLFSFAAICNQCAADIGDEEDLEADVEEAVADEDNGDGDTEEDIDTDNEDDTDIDDTDDDANAGDDDSDTDDTDTEKEAPTLSLEIYEGPIYSADDDICYWRVEADLDGSPNPTISWSRDNSNGSFGNKKAQVNLSRGETYTLIATATNSEGSVEESIILDWGCDEPDPEPEPEPEPDPTYVVINRCDPYWNLCGYIDKDTHVITRVVWVGDNASNRGLKGYISFDISELYGPEVLDARLELNNITFAGDPTFADNMIIKAYRFDNELDLGDWAIGGTQITSVSTGGLGSIVITGASLISSVQEAVDNYGDYFQIKIGLSRESDGDGTAEFFNIDLNNALLIVDTNADH